MLFNIDLKKYIYNEKCYKEYTMYLMVNGVDTDKMYGNQAKV